VLLVHIDDSFVVVKQRFLVLIIDISLQYFDILVVIELLTYSIPIKTNKEEYEGESG
jgi:hypothetical protein